MGGPVAADQQRSELKRDEERRAAAEELLQRKQPRGAAQTRPVRLRRGGAVRGAVRAEGEGGGRRRVDKRDADGDGDGVRLQPKGGQPGSRDGESLGERLGERTPPPPLLSLSLSPSRPLRRRARLGRHQAQLPERWQCHLVEREGEGEEERLEGEGEQGVAIEGRSPVVCARDVVLCAARDD